MLAFSHAESAPLYECEAIPYLDTAKALHSSTSLPSDIDPQQAGEAFRGQLEALTLLLQSNLPTITTKLYCKSIISPNAMQEALNPNHTEDVRAVSLLSVVENRIKAEPHVFTEFVKILESEPTLRSQAEGLVANYLKKWYVYKSKIVSVICFIKYDENIVSYTLT